MQDPTTAEGIGTQKGRHQGRQETQRDSLEPQPATRLGPFATTVAALDEVFAECPAVQRADLKWTPVPAMQRPWPYWLLFAGVLLVCVYLLLRPTPVPQWFANSDKLGHAGGFFALVLLGYGATPRASAFFVLLLTGLIGLAIGSEWLQQTSLLPLRHASVWDLAADLSGLALGLMLAAALDQRLRWSWRSRLSEGSACVRR